MALLEADEMSVTFGGLRAVDGANLRVEEGQLVGLIGPNGAGKTTCIDALTGFVPTSNGSIRLQGRDITSVPPHRRSHLGLGRTWQSVEPFQDLSVRENLEVAVDRPRWWSPLADILRPNRDRSMPSVDWALGLLGLDELGSRMPSELPHGQRKLLGVARALAAEPRLVLMDEPAAGLDTEESQLLGRRLRGITDHGITVFLVDHDMGLVLSVCDYIYVIEFGRLIAEGPPAEIRADERVISAYLGEQARDDVEKAKRTLAEVDVVQGEQASSTAGTGSDAAAQVQG